MPQTLTLRKDNLKTLNDFQKLLGDINWIRGYLKLPNYELKPLFDTLKGDTDLNSPRDLTESTRFGLKRVEEALSATCLNRIQDGQPFDLCIFPTETQPTGVLWQKGPLMWLHSHFSPGKALEYYPEAVAELAIQGVQQSLQFFGVYPQSIIVPYSAYQVQILCATIDNWSILRCMFPGDIDNHLPKDPLLRFVKEHPVIFPNVTARKPIRGAINIFTDGSKTGCGVYVAGNQGPVQHQFVPGNPQIVELMIVIEVFKAFPCPFNLISDSAYVINPLKILEAVGTIKATSSVLAPFTLLQSLIWQRKEPFFPMHIRAHAGLPGPLTKGNALADAHTRAEWALYATSVDLAKDFHARFHVNVRTLQSRFSLSRADAGQVIKECPRCIIYHKPPTFGVNPRGLRPLQVWQMDVTHVPEFGRLKYLHISVDTFSGVVLATPLPGEKATDVISHCLEVWAAWGMPKQLKTDNGPAYTGQRFVSFCTQMGVTLVHGLPYNPQGQGIVERAHHTIKEMLQKQKGGAGPLMATARQRIAMTLFTLNFLNLDNAGRSSADRHNCSTPSALGSALWKDVLTGLWNGPDPVLVRARGSVCVFPQNCSDPVWVPERLVRRVQDEQNPEETKDCVADHTAPDDLTGTGGSEMGDTVCIPEAHARET
ncbi:PREDICTED: endogenous retrovirus group K member 8 Pol protein-like [Dipodomys ordii]|uniref:RNA-directed DNA polymerase n=1 Tax=Dipodomys ordii TaxID=10020 RepID=A0A1S3GS19_DIPOR|nr:PREDICTED: endogenous retrovirus group K member 8 Pol protein-like [Dipodomys ordii]